MRNQTVIQTLQSRYLNHKLHHGQDHMKHPLFPTCPRRINAVTDVSYVEQHRPFVINASYLSDVVQKRVDPLAEGVLRRFFPFHCRSGRSRTFLPYML